uniref:NADH-ubiquinone oxidoreductase chain 2 n=1 Tax=Plautia fimbriata TaxID=286708 RepID=A0A4D6X0M9_9HEMI|nr:NADH dehydrogenase subunit 2 [Plautia fimbriata]QCI09417.1 NADH dehydrogenase subunit 2 [Plautia fimbriata]
MKKSMLLFLITLITSTIITVSSNNWIGMWMGLELNMMSFIPIIMSKTNKSNSEAAMIYFLTQSISSMLLLTMVFMSLMFKNPFMTMMMNIIITMSLLIKLGAAPFHKWMPDMLSKMSWNNCMLLMTWQKIAPLTMISNMNNMSLMMNMSIIWSIGIGSIGGINQSSLRKMMGYSSINHLGWMLAINKSMNLWIMYLIIYMILTIMVCKLFNKYKMFFINQISTLNMTNSEKINMFIMMMSMGGLPPFIGFLPKWITIQSMVDNKEFMLMFIMIMFSLVTLLYYIRIMTSMFLTYSTSIKWSTFNNNSSMMMMSINMMLPIIIITDMI